MKCRQLLIWIIEIGPKYNAHKSKDIKTLGSNSYLLLVKRYKYKQFFIAKSIHNFKLKYKGNSFCKSSIDQSNENLTLFLSFISRYVKFILYIICLSVTIFDWFMNRALVLSLMILLPKIVLQNFMVYYCFCVSTSGLYLNLFLTAVYSKQ